MSLTETVSKIKGREVTEEFAKQFALDQFGLLCSWMRENCYKITWKEPA